MGRPHRARTTFAELRKLRARLAETAIDPDAGPDPVATDRVESFGARREMVHLLDFLPDDQRHALVLHHVLGLTVPEMAAELHIPQETVRSRLRLARARLLAARDTGLTDSEGREETHDE